MAKREMDIETKLSPDRVIAALTDFSERRPDVWPFLARELYRVYSVGETSAVVQEGSTRPVRVWARERYDWSTPGTVSWTVEESDSFESGRGMSVRVTPGSSGGSTVHIVWERVGKNTKGRFVVRMIALMRARPIASSFKKVFDALAEHG